MPVTRISLYRQDFTAFKQPRIMSLQKWHLVPHCSGRKGAFTPIEREDSEHSRILGDTGGGGGGNALGV